MALVVADRVQETTTTTGTGTYTLAGAKDGFQSFGAVGNGNTTYYACTDGTDYEVGIGTYTLSGTTLARTTIIESSNSDAAVNWGAGEKDIFVTLPASKAVVLDASGNATFSGSATFTTDTNLNGITAGNQTIYRGSGALKLIGGGPQNSRNLVNLSNNAGATIYGGSASTNATLRSTYGVTIDGGDGDVTFASDVTFDGDAADIIFDKSHDALAFRQGAALKFASTSSTAQQSRIQWDGTRTHWETFNSTRVDLDGDFRFVGASYNVEWDKSDNALEFGDNAKAVFGAGSDLQIFHDGTHTYIDETNPTGYLFIRGANTQLLNPSNEIYLECNNNGSVDLYHDNSKKLATTSTGIDVTGNITVSGTVDGRDVATDGTKLDGIEAGANVGPSLAVAIALG